MGMSAEVTIYPWAGRGCGVANLLEVVEAAGADVAVALVDEVLFAATVSVRVVAATVTAAAAKPSERGCTHDEGVARAGEGQRAVRKVTIEVNPFAALQVDRTERLPCAAITRQSTLV